MIQLKGITNQWNGVPMLQDAALLVEEGSFFGLFGKDDAGKTTLLHIITILYRQIKRKLVTQNYRAFEMAASCILCILLR